QSIQFYRRSRLGHKVGGRVCERVNEAIYCDLCIRCVAGTNAEGGICRVGKIDVKEPGMNLGQGHAAGSRAIDGEHHFVSTCRRRITFGGGGNEAIGSAYIRRAKREPNRVGRTASEHAGAVKSISTDAIES